MDHGVHRTLVDHPWNIHNTSNYMSSSRAVTIPRQHVEGMCDVWLCVSSDVTEHADDRSEGCLGNLSIFSIIFGIVFFGW